MENCVNCKYHETFYSKCATTFYRNRKGYCSQCKKLTENHEHCEKWQRKKTTGIHNLRKQAVLKVLTRISYDLSVIAQILEDDRKESEEEKD